MNKIFLRLTIFIALFLIAKFSLSQEIINQFSPYQDKLFHHQISNEVTEMKIAETFFDDRETESHILASEKVNTADAQFILVVVGSSLGPGLDCTACTSVLHCLVYKRDNEGYFNLNTKILGFANVGQFGNFPQRTEIIQLGKEKIGIRLDNAYTQQGTGIEHLDIYHYDFETNTIQPVLTFQRELESENPMNVLFESSDYEFSTIRLIEANSTKEFIYNFDQEKLKYTPRD